jgi:alcohol dehydrogenase (NADP+)
MDELIDNSKREFLLQSAVLGAGAVLAGPRGVFAQQPVAQGSGPYPTEGMAGYSATRPLQLLKFQRRALGPKDVAIRIDYCGVCHSDIHTIRGDWGTIQYPLVVGHELAGEVVAIGTSVSKFEVGSRVGVGTMVDSCRRCAECGLENYCENGNTQTYGSKDRDGSITQGGYSKFIVVDEDFVLKIPASIDLAEAGPLLCAGITTYSPLRHWGVAAGKKVAIAGLGGLGHVAVQFATKMGADVTVVTTSPEKEQDARRFGAKDVLINKNGADFSKHKRAFDFILDTIPYQHDLDRFLPLLKRDATICRVGVGKLTTPNEYGQMTTVLMRTSLAGSNTGGIRETQDMLEFCAAQKIKPQITKIPMSGINDAWSKVVAKHARYRFVIDMKA